MKAKEDYPAKYIHQRKMYFKHRINQLKEDYEEYFYIAFAGLCLDNPEDIDLIKEAEKELKEEEDALHTPQRSRRTLLGGNRRPGKR